MKTTTIITVALAFSLMASGCKNRGKQPTEELPACVYVFTPEGNTNLSTTTHASTIEEGKSVNAAFKIGGQIKRLTAGEGVYVRKGQTIGYLDDVDYRLQLNQLETQYAQVSSEISRIEKMYRHNSVSQNDYEKAKAGLQQLKIQLEMTKNQLSYTRLTAPVSGYIVERYLEEGEMAGGGTPVYKIIDNSGVEASVALSANAYSKRNLIIKCVGKSQVTGDSEIPLDIISFIPDGDSNSLFKLRLKVPDAYRDRLLPGMNINVEITYRSGEETEKQLIPSRSLFEQSGLTFVWVVNKADSTLTAREVTVIGAPDGKRSQVSGLGSGEMIVAAGVHHLHNNQKVKIIGTIDSLNDNAAL